MSLNSINHILDILEIPAKLQEQPFQRLLKIWSEAVGTLVAAHTRPLSIQGDVLRVATSSAAWAQNLTFERQPLLLKLNTLLVLPAPLVDIRFSTAQWRLSKDIPRKEQTVLLPEHPSYVSDRPKVEIDVPMKKNANAAFEYWAKTVQARSRNLPLCPQCESPSPNGELRRWGVCSLCAAKQFSVNP